MEFDFKEKSNEELETRMSEIAIELDNEGADLDALTEEVRAIKAEQETRKAEAEKKAEIRAAVAAGNMPVIKTFEEGKKDMPTNEEVRASAEYMDAFKNYILNNDDSECRALLTTNVSGVVPVPVIVDDIIRTAWENDPILSRVRRTYLRGNVKVGFELSADGAYVHTEGTTAPTEESLTIGIVTMVPANIKKWIRISDEAVTMGGEAFLRYVYDELTYQITKKLAALVVGDITGAATTNSATAVGVPKVTQAPSVVALPTAAANLTDEATDIVVIMNRLTEVEFISAYAAGNFAVDPFAGMTKLYTSALPAYSAAAAGAVYAIVGDLSAVQVNYPEGDSVAIKYDDLTEAEKDMVKIVGRQYAAHAITAPGRLVNVAKPSGT
jgi:HK97 family phage major capsid protein